MALAGCYLLSRLELAVLVVGAFFLQMFSGNWSLVGIPLPLDRVALVVALIVLVLKGAPLDDYQTSRAAASALGAPVRGRLGCRSGIIVGTIFGHLGFYSCWTGSGSSHLPCSPWCR